MTDKVRLEIDGPIAVITNDNPEKHNAFDDEMDGRLFDILGELKERPDVRAVIWRMPYSSLTDCSRSWAVRTSSSEPTSRPLWFMMFISRTWLVWTPA